MFRFALSIHVVDADLLQMSPTPSPPPESDVPDGTRAALPASSRNGKRKAVSPPARRSPVKRTVSKAPTPVEVQREGLDMLGRRLDNFGDNFRETVTGRPAGLTATPLRYGDALKLMQRQEKHRSPEEMLDLIDIFNMPVTGKQAMTTYLNLDDKRLRDAWVTRALNAAAEARQAQLPDPFAGY
jgi:hypothetical protein